MLAKLGDESFSQKAAVLRLKNVNCTDAADGPGSLQRAEAAGHRLASPSWQSLDDNALIVFATPIDLLTVRELLAKHIDAPAPAGKPEPPPKSDEKRFSMWFQDLSWDDVLDWYGKTSGLTPILTVKPKGQFTFMPPRADQKYTLAEITDILNEALDSQKFILIRRQVYVHHPSGRRED